MPVQASSIVGGRLLSLRTGFREFLSPGTHGISLIIFSFDQIPFVPVIKPFSLHASLRDPPENFIAPTQEEPSTSFCVPFLMTYRFPRDERMFQDGSFLTSPTYFPSEKQDPPTLPKSISRSLGMLLGSEMSHFNCLSPAHHSRDGLRISPLLFSRPIERWLIE